MQQEFVEFNQLNWNTHNDLTRLRVDLEWMMQNYAKMESNLEQHVETIGSEERLHIQST